MSYKILASDWFTPPLVGILYDALTGISENLCIGVVAIETGTGDWKAYIGYGTTGDQKRDEQSIAANGSKLVPKSIACAHFPSLDPERFVY
jgi:hypothetical protein